MDWAILTFLAAPIERALNSELDGMTVSIEGAVLHRSERGGVEIRLREMRLHDAGGSQLAEAASAGVEIDMKSLIKGRIAARRIELIDCQYQTVNFFSFL